MNCKRVIFSGHAIRQMFNRRISKNNVLHIIKNGQIIIDYPDDQPYPSCLLLGFIDDKPIHVVLANDKENQTGIVITAYIPDPLLWSDDFKARRK